MAANPSTVAASESSSLDSSSGSGVSGSSDAASNPSANSVESLFSAVNVYLHAELNNSSQDYQLLTQLNQAAASRYAALGDESNKLLAAINTINSTYLSLAPSLSLLNSLDGELSSLESVVASLDDQSKKLVEQFKMLYK